MRKNVKVNWNQQYRMFREKLSHELGSKRKVVYTRAEFFRLACNAIGGVTDDGEFHRSVRTMMTEINVKIVIGQKQVTMTPIHPVKIGADQWIAIIENGVKRVLDHLAERKATEHGMTLDAFRNLMTFWPNTPVFNMRLQAEFREYGYGFQHNKTTVVIRKLATEEIPRMQLHNGRTLLHVLCTPVITQKRRWAKGFSHALMVNGTTLISVTEPVNDDNDVPMHNIAIGRDNVLLVNEAALKIITRAFLDHPDEVIVRQL